MSSGPSQKFFPSRWRHAVKLVLIPGFSQRSFVTISWYLMSGTSRVLGWIRSAAGGVFLKLGVMPLVLAVAGLVMGQSPWRRIVIQAPPPARR